jgi:O-antigen/teichoic acid export membrane protein
MATNRIDVTTGFVGAARVEPMPFERAAKRPRVWTLDPGVVVVVGTRCLGIAVGIVSSVITARYLQPAGRGEYFVALTAAQLLAQFGNLGLHSSNTYFLARERGLFAGLLANSVWVSFLVMPLMAAMLISAAPAGLFGALSFSGRLFVVSVAPFMVFSVLGGGLMVGLNQVTSFGFMQPLNATLILLFMLVAASVHAGPNGFLAASAAGWIAAVAVMLWLLYRQTSGAVAFRREIFGSTFGYSTKAYLATLAGFIVLRLNVFTLHAMSGAEQVGYYSVASQIADTLGILPQSTALVLFPRLAACKTGQLKMMMRDALRIGAVLALACAAVWLLASPAIRLAFGARFAPAVPVLRAMLPGVLLLGVMSIVSQYLAANDFPVSLVAAWLTAGVSTAVLGRPLVARYGAVGAAATLSIVYAGLLTALLVLCWRVSVARASASQTT